MHKMTVKEMTGLIETKLSHNFGVKPGQASDDCFYKACALVLMDIMKERRSSFKEEVAECDAKQVYYLSMEFLMGRSFKNTLYNLGLERSWPRHWRGWAFGWTGCMTWSPTRGWATAG